MSIESYEPEVRALERTRLNVECPVVFYGSSSIRLWPKLGTGDAIVNRGFGGSTLEACAYYFDRLVLPLNPRSMIIYAGDNDLGDGYRPEQVLGSFRELARKIESKLPGVQFGFISIKPSPARFAILDRIRFANRLIQEEIEKHSSGYFIPVYDAMLDGAGRPRNELFLSDGLHLSLTGYRLWESLLAPFQNRIFTPLSSNCNKPQLSL
jgi:lysophospholipase L1-like esterase